MRHLFLLSVVATLALAGCGEPNTSPSPPGNGGSATSTPPAPTPRIRALIPADLNADGNPDAIPHTSLRRLLVQAPAGTGFRLTRGGVDMPFAVALVTLDDGKTVHELTLEDPIGTAALTLRAEGYTLNLQGSPDFGIQQQLTARAATTGALTNDLAKPNGALFPGVEDVALALSGGLPSLVESGIVLQSGQGREIPLRLSLTPEGLIAKPAAALEPRRTYALKLTGKLVDPYGREADTRFHLMCRGGAGKAPIRLKLGDLNRDGDDELIALFEDGSVTALTNPQGRAEGILPRGTDTGVDFAAGDFDGNGATDVVVLLRVQDGFRLLTLYNQTRVGESRFLMQSDAIPLEAPVAVCAGDFDRDGRDDVMILDAFGDVLAQYSSRATQLFSALDSRRLACAIVCDDINADGKPDLYVMGADGTGRLHLNVGSGFGGELGVLDVNSPGAQRVVTGEIDGDRHADFIFTGRGSTMTVMMGVTLNSPGTFRMNGETERLAGAMLCRDVNRDTRRDILVAREDDRGITDEVAIYLNSDRVDGSPDAILPLGARVSVDAIDYWRDHVVFASNAGLLVLKVNPADMPPTVDSKVRFIEAYHPVPPIPAPLAAAMADFNDDGKSDLAAIDRDGNLQIWLSGDEGEPFTASGDPIALDGPGVLQAIDFDRDSAPDLLYIPNDRSRKPRVLRNNRAGRFDGNDEGFLPTPPSNLRGAPALGDFDRDGDLDALWPSPLGWVQYREREDRWSAGQSLPEIRDDASLRLQFSGELCCADFTGDSIEDVVAVMQTTEDGAGPQYLVLFEGTGSTDFATGPFRVVISTQIKGRLFGLSPADFNGDGKLDLAVGFGQTEADAQLTLLQLGADKQFVTFEGSPAPKGKLLDIALDDLDRDGDLDLIVSEDSIDHGNVMTLWVNDGRGRFGEATEAQRSLSEAMGGFRATNLSLADFTGDGRPDLMAIDRDGNVVIVRTTLP
ncbi:MAG: VCBS repeat-containing protein [Planctomycetes bacterium]|nr:VCBS repeat-containing protein [Planctomycetota bacterium]